MAWFGLTTAMERCYFYFVALMAIVATSHLSRNHRHEAQALNRAWIRAGAIRLLLCLTLVWTVAAYADTAAFDFDEPGRGLTVSGTDGFQFTPHRDLVVTALGYYDHERDGLQNPHPVALFSALSRSPLVSVTVTPTSRLVGNFRYERTPPLVLKAGHSYVIAAFTSGNEDPPADSPSDLRVASPIGYEGYLFEFGESLGFPTNKDLFSSRTFFGPNFQFRPAPGGVVWGPPGDVPGG